MRHAVSVTLLACLVLSACASARKADVSLPAAFEAPTPSAAIDIERWWTVFEDPQLNTLIEQALVANPDARTAAARLREVRADRINALTSFLPTGDATGSARETHTRQLSGTAINIPGFSTNGKSEAYAANFNVSWELDLFGRIFAARRAVNADVAAARFAYEGARASLAAQVADSYFQARGLAIQLADARESARIQRGLYEVAFKRGQVGIAATSEADRISGDLAQSEAQVASLEADLQVQRRTLLVLAGRIVEPTSAVTVEARVGRLPEIPASIPSTLLQRRPDVREAEARVRSAAGRLDVAQLAFFPTFTLTPGIGWSKTIQPGFSSETRNWSLGAAATQPILSIPRLLAELKAQDARTEQAVIAYEKAVQTAFSEAEGSLVRLDADRRRVALLADGAARAGRAYEASRIGYTRGLTDLQTALGAEQSWRATRTQYTAAQVQGLRQAVQAYKALGGGWRPEDYPPNARAR